jgi:hypothetical protein
MLDQVSSISKGVPEKFGMHLGSTEAVPKGSLFSRLPGSYAGSTKLCVKE